MTVVKPVITSAANRGYQVKLDRLEAMAEAGDWAGVAAFEVKGSNSYSKIVARYRDALMMDSGYVDDITAEDEAWRATMRAEVSARVAAETTTSQVYEASPIKRHRATEAEAESRREALFEIVKTGQPMTVRQVFYQATVHGIVEKAETGYKKVGAI